MNAYALAVLAALFVCFILVPWLKRDCYVVVREFRVVTPEEFGKGKQIEAYYTHSFDDYLAARAFFDLHESFATRPDYENRQAINYLYAIPAFNAKMARKPHHEAKLLVETSYSVLSALKKHWDEERNARKELRELEAETLSPNPG